MPLEENNLNKGRSTIQTRLSLIVLFIMRDVRIYMMLLSLMFRSIVVQ